jgi:hypothetical protein
MSMFSNKQQLSVVFAINLNFEMSVCEEFLDFFRLKRKLEIRNLRFIFFQRF